MFNNIGSTVLHYHSRSLSSEELFVLSDQQSSAVVPSSKEDAEDCLQLVIRQLHEALLDQGCVRPIPELCAIIGWKVTHNGA